MSVSTRTSRPPNKLLGLRGSLISPLPGNWAPRRSPRVATRGCLMTRGFLPILLALDHQPSLPKSFLDSLIKTPTPSLPEPDTLSFDLADSLKVQLRQVNRRLDDVQKDFCFDFHCACVTPTEVSNSGIIAKVFVRKISFKLHVMRLNRSRCSYCVFVGGAVSPQGRPASLAGVAVTRGHTRLQRGARKGSRLQSTRKGLPPAASLVANRGGGIGRSGGRPLAGWLPTGKGSHRLRRGSNDDDGSADGAIGVRASF
ncbi:hypothetical protein B296_00050303 [Ensete ventricosum]|uniref:Uncharacterized protein n=1 Tax=Ensete ventricosum TaxID=4639 RepID=A0A426XZJ2_ENSVE|nr:hypothetical protein B296_00050303 [Ensete ventricosum]